MCKKQKKKFFISNNVKLAINLNLDGVYLPSFNKKININIMSRRKKFLIIGSAHSIKEIKIKEKQGAKMIFLSPILLLSNPLKFILIKKTKQHIVKKVQFLFLKEQQLIQKVLK